MLGAGAGSEPWFGLGFEGRNKAVGDRFRLAAVGTPARLPRHSVSTVSTVWAMHLLCTYYALTMCLLLTYYALIIKHFLCTYYALTMHLLCAYY